MKTLFFFVYFTSISLYLSAQTNKYENGSRDFSFKDTNYLYIGVVNKFHLEKEKLGIVRIISTDSGISSQLNGTTLEVSPKHEGVFALIMEAPEREYKVLFVVKRVPDPAL